MFGVPGTHNKSTNGKAIISTVRTAHNGPYITDQCAFLVRWVRSVASSCDNDK